MLPPTFSLDSQWPPTILILESPLYEWCVTTFENCYFWSISCGNSQKDSAAETRFGLDTMWSRIQFDSKLIANDSNIIRLEDSCQVDHGNSSRSMETPVTRSLKAHAGVCFPTLRSQLCILILPTLWNIRRAASA